MAATDGPYIVATKREIPRGEQRGVNEHLSRRAVATLDEAREKVWTRMSAAGSVGSAVLSAFNHLSESGTIGPLPDGTVIEVEATTWLYLAAGIDAAIRNRAVNGDTAMQQRILDAYNARQVTS